jgi:hypothetical protein
MSTKPTDPTKQNISNNKEKPDAKVKKPDQSLTDEELGKASGGIRPGPRLDDDVFVKISGPSWVNLMAYRKAGWAAEPERKRSLVDLHRELETEAADDE